MQKYNELKFKIKKTKTFKCNHISLYLEGDSLNSMTL